MSSYAALNLNSRRYIAYRPCPEMQGQDHSEIVMIDEATSEVRARWPLAPCTEPTGLAIDAVHHQLFAVCANRKMVVLDARTGRLVAQVPIGEGPDGAGFDAGRGLAFSANGAVR